MKKTRFFALAASLLALGFGFMGCDSGDGEDSYKEETPTTWVQLEGTATTSVTAKWTFDTDTLPIGVAEVSIEGKEIPANSGEGATLVGGNGLGIKWVAPTGTLTDDMGASTGRIQASNKTASLETPENGAMLLLTTTADTNITVRAKGAGAATSARIFLIRQKGSEENLVYKDNLYSAGSKFIAFHLKNAPAGTYEIYFNGSTISEIDCNSTTTVTEPKAYSSNDDLQMVSGSYINLSATATGEFDVETTKFKFDGSNDQTWGEVKAQYPYYVVSSAGDASKKASVNFYPAYETKTVEGLVGTVLLTLVDKDFNDDTASAEWSSSNKSVATVSAGVVTAVGAGETTIRGRVGRFYKEVKVKVTEPKHTLVTTFCNENIPKATTKISEMTSDELAALKKTKVSGLSSPLVTTEETAEYEYGEANEVPTEESGDNRVSKGPGIGMSYKSTSTNSEVGKKFVTYTFKVTPVSGKTVKLDGVTGLLNCGKGTGVLSAKAYVGDATTTEIALPITKNNLVSYNSISAEKSVTLSSGENTIKVVVEVVASGKNGISLQVQDIGLTFSE